MTWGLSGFYLTFISRFLQLSARVPALKEKAEGQKASRRSL